MMWHQTLSKQWTIFQSVHCLAIRMMSFPDNNPHGDFPDFGQFPDISGFSRQSTALQSLSNHTQLAQKSSLATETSSWRWFCPRCWSSCACRTAAVSHGTFRPVPAHWWPCRREHSSSAGDTPARWAPPSVDVLHSQQANCAVAVTDGVAR